MKYKFFKIIMIFLVILTISIFLINVFSKKIEPIFLNYSESEMKRVVNIIVSKSVDESVLSDNIFILHKDSNGMVIVDYDPIVINKIISNISNNIYNTLKLLEDNNLSVLDKYNIDKSIFYIPSGIIFNSLLLNNLGPKIPIKLKLIGSVNPNIETKVSEYGINNSLIEVSVKINTSIRMILPFSSKEVNIVNIIPLTVKIIQGNIPEYYLGPLLNKKSS